MIEKKGKPTREAYFAANIMGLVDCIDKEKSKYRAWGGESDAITSIEKLVLKNQQCNTIEIFRASSFTRLILLDRSFKEKIESADFTGIRLVEPDRWDGYNGER